MRPGEAVNPEGVITYTEWRDQLRVALAGAADADVPCGTCTACCTSAQFVHITPDETETIARIPKALRFAAPGLPKGHMVLGFDERGHCPMLVEGSCSIYEHRPRTCRVYDCRVFAATGIVDTDERRVEIRTRAEQWQFGVEADDDRAAYNATRAAAQALTDAGPDLDGVPLPVNPTQLAVFAFELQDLFLEATPDEATLRAAIEAIRFRDQPARRLGNRRSLT